MTVTYEYIISKSIRQLSVGNNQKMRREKSKQLVKMQRPKPQSNIWETPQAGLESKVVKMKPIFLLAANRILKSETRNRDFEDIKLEGR